MKVAIITEGFQGTGYGHLTRCLSIYQAFKEKNIDPIFIANIDLSGKSFLPGVNLLQLDWINKVDELSALIKYFDIAIIDSYNAPIEIYNIIQAIVHKPVYIDDYLRLNYPAGVIINGTIGAENFSYNNSDQHTNLLGIDYIPLRKEFWDVEKTNNDKKNARNVLVTFGGQDYGGLTFKVLDAINKQHPELNYFVIKDLNSVELSRKSYSPRNVHFYNFLSSLEMLEIMLSCNIAISSGGQTLNELARLGVPTIAIQTAENQRYNLLGWKSYNFIDEIILLENKYYVVEIINSLNSIINKSEMRKKNNNFLDGQGCRKIIEKLIE